MRWAIIPCLVAALTAWDSSDADFSVAIRWKMLAAIVIVVLVCEFVKGTLGENLADSDIPVKEQK